MNRLTKVNLHCHSVFSDGTLTPQALADGLAAAGVDYAALTDHNNINGLLEFQAALQRHQIGFISGVEVTAKWDEIEVHLLAYGFNPDYPELAATLHALRQTQDLGIHSIAASMRRSGDASRLSRNFEPFSAPDGQLAIKDAFSLIHRAGGLVFLAHPFALRSDIIKLEEAVVLLKAWGLDGLEVFYEPYSSDQCSELETIALKYGLLMCGGTDVHSNSDPFTNSMPTQVWKQFRDAVTRKSNDLNDRSQEFLQQDGIAQKNPVQSRIYRRRYFVLRILLPTILAISLFIIMIWGMILPSFESILLERKRELIRELTNTVHGILVSLDRDTRAGLLTIAEAQQLAITQIKALRYGSESRDYFWLQDMVPRIIMHPYRTDLDGQDVSAFADPRGVYIFIEFSELVKRKGEGYIEYVWQWMDDPQRLEAKESYVKGFEPWGWIIGTGIYIEDVHQEIARIENNLVIASLIVSGIVIILLAFVVQQSLRIETHRRRIERSLHDSTERYRSLVEATTEGTLLVLNGRCRYANPKLLRMLNLSNQHLELMDLGDVLPRVDVNSNAWKYLDSVEGFREPGSFLGVLQRSDRSTIECVLALNPITSGGLFGYILLAKEVAIRTNAEGSSETLSQLAQHSPVGLFRAKAVRRGVFSEANQATLDLLHLLGFAQVDQPALADLFHDDGEYNDFIEQVVKQEGIDAYILHLETINAATITITLSVRLVRDSKGQPDWLDGTFLDVTSSQKLSSAKDALIEKLQTSLLFLQEPVSSVRQQCITCGLETPIQKATALMTTHNASVIMVKSETGAVVGMVTDHDLRARVLATSMDLQTPVHRIMSAPLVTINENALIYQALMLMEEQGLQYLAVEDDAGQVIGVIRSKELVQFHRYGSIVLTREINNSKSIQEISRFLERTPGLVRALLASGGKPRNITYMLSTLCDATTERLIDLTIRDLGIPPSDFCFIAMGSQGRQEQTLLTDQDNAIIYGPLSNSDQRQMVDEYFSQLSSRVCAGLAQAGYAVCHGQFMANQPAWRADLVAWKEYFASWIRNAEPQELLKFSIFFDFRPVFGNADLAHELRLFIHQMIDGQPSFFPQFAQNSLSFKPPTRFPGKIYLSSGTDHSGQINLKDAMQPVVDFARLFALQHHITQTNTLGRLDALVDSKVLTPSSRDEISSAFDFLMKLRLQYQLDTGQNGLPLDNILHTAKISHFDDSLLQQAFTQISAIQKKISFDFLKGI